MNDKEIATLAFWIASVIAVFAHIKENPLATILYMPCAFAFLFMLLIPSFSKSDVRDALGRDRWRTVAQLCGELAEHHRIYKWRMELFPPLSNVRAQLHELCEEGIAEGRQEPILAFRLRRSGAPNDEYA